MTTAIEIALRIDAAHPAFDGHFPARPIVPGVVLLDEAIRAIEAHAAHDFMLRHALSSVKFLKPVGPDAQLVLRIDFGPGSQLAFKFEEHGRPVATGRFAPIARG